jgi:hypothetical protein
MELEGGIALKKHAPSEPVQITTPVRTLPVENRDEVHNKIGLMVNQWK